MSTYPKTLTVAMSELLQAGSVLVGAERSLHMEVVEKATGLVWMTVEPVTPPDFESLELDDSLAKVGIGQASMDSAAFLYSPGAPDEPVRERRINGLRYINVAQPMTPKPPAQKGEPVQIMVNKAHVVGYKVGRRVRILSLEGNDYVEVVGDSNTDDTLLMPQGGILRSIDLQHPWVVALPNPTRTFFWFDGSLRSFQGPVTLPNQG